MYKNEMDPVEPQPEYQCLSRREKLEFVINGLDLDPKDAAIFGKYNLDLEDLLMLTDDDIKELGIKDSTLRKKLNNLVEKFKIKTSVFKKDNSDDELDENEKNNFLLQDCLSILSNNSEHLEYIQDSLHLLHKSLKIDGKIPNFMLSPQHSLGEGLEILTDANQKQVGALIDSIKKLEEKIIQEFIDPPAPKRKKNKKSNGPIYICLGLLLSSSIILGICTWKELVK